MSDRFLDGLRIRSTVEAERDERPPNRMNVHAAILLAALDLGLFTAGVEHPQKAVPPRGVATMHGAFADASVISLSLAMIFPRIIARR